MNTQNMHTNNDKGTCDIMLVYPPAVTKGRYSQVATGHEVAPQPLLYLGGILRKNKYACHLLDANAQGISIEQTISRILEARPRFVGVSSPTMLISSTGAILKGVKQAAPEIVTIAGGPHITVVPRETMQAYPHIDIGVLGEGEVTLIELIKALEAKKDVSGIKGIAYRENGQIKITPPRPYIENLDSLPLPAWDMFPDFTKVYQQSAVRIDRQPCISIVTSRGCPFKCIFCARNVFGNVTRAHSTDYLLKMIRHLKQTYNIRSISFEDENFVVFKERLVEFCNALIKEKMDITWDCASHVNSVNPELLALMKKAGCWQINFGLESGCQRILDFIKKGSTVERIKKALQMTRKAGIKTKGYFIIGHPTETLESIQETIDFIKKIDLDIFQMSFMVPFPGTELLSIGKQYGAVNNDWDNMNIWMPLFIPKGLSEDILKSESKRAYREFYFRPKPIAQFMIRACRPSVFGKFSRDGLKILKFLVSRD